MMQYNSDTTDTTCRQCGQTQECHKSDKTCYTTDELINRLRFAQREGRWPGPDEGCEEFADV
jgi:hypothetical protein